MSGSLSCDSWRYQQHCWKPSMPDTTKDAMTTTGPSAEVPQWQQFWTDLCEKDDRTSPEEYPDMALIKEDELYYLLDAAYRRGVGNAKKIVCMWDPLSERFDDIPYEAETIKAMLLQNIAALTPSQEGS